MATTFDIIPGFMEGLKNGVSFFNSDIYPVGYAPSSADIVITGRTVTFPDLLKANAYQWQQWQTSSSGSSVTESALSLITMIGQEWGPASINPTSGCQIDDVVIGTIPDTADTFLVEVKGTRTTSPSNVNGNAIPTFIQEGEWNPAYGGSLVVEWLYPISRMLQFYKAVTVNGDGTRNILMRMKQSVTKKRQGFYRSDNDATKTGWTYGGTNGSAYGIPVSQRAVGGPTVDPSGVGRRLSRGGAAALSVVDNTNYRSIYSFDFKITPGRTSIAPNTGGGGISAYFGLVDEQFEESAAAAVHTVPVQYGDPDPTRNLIVGIVTSNGNNSARDITSVTIGGVLATQVAYRKSTNGNSVMLAGIYTVPMPTGTSGNIVVTCSGTTNQCSVSVFAGYNMNSLTPDATVSSGLANTDSTLATVNGGLALAVGMNAPSSWANLEFFNTPYSTFWITGMSNPSLFSTIPSTGGGQAYSRNFDLTTGASFTLRQNYIGGSPAGPITPTVEAFVAASFH